MLTALRCSAAMSMTEAKLSKRENHDEPVKQCLLRFTSSKAQRGFSLLS